MKRQSAGLALRALSVLALAGCGNAALAQTAPANDNWANAIQINDPNAPVALTAATPYTVTVGGAATPLSSATVEATDPKITCKTNAFNAPEGQMANTLWFTYTTGSAVEYVNIKATEGTQPTPVNFDSVLAVWTGAPATGFRMVTGGCNDDGVPNATINNYSRIAGLKLLPNTTYSIEVAFAPAPATAPPASAVLRLDMASSTILNVDTTTDTVPVNFTGWTLTPGPGNPNPCLNPTMPGTCSLRAAAETAAILGELTPVQTPTVTSLAAGAAILVPAGTYQLTAYNNGAVGSVTTDPSKVLNVGGGDIDLLGSVGIYGAGMGQTTIIVPPSDRALSVQAAFFNATTVPPGIAGNTWSRFGKVNVIVEDVTLQGPYPAGPPSPLPVVTGPASGGLVSASGFDAFERVEFKGGYAFGNGGAINDGSPLQVRDSRFINNTATFNSNNNPGAGGAISHSNSPDWSYIEVNGSTFSGNFAAAELNNGSVTGGGAILASGYLVLTNSTLSGNGTNGYGGALMFNRLNGGAPILEARNSTIVDNVANADGNGIGTGGGVYLDAATSLNNTPPAPSTPPTVPVPTANMFANSILANNSVHGNTATSGANCVATPYADGTSQVLVNATYSLTNQAGTDVCAFAGNGNVVGMDPALNALADNGGFTQTRALQPGSPAVDAGDPAGCLRHSGVVLATDQRGNVRPTGGRCDIGAFELAGMGNAPGVPVLAAASDTGDSNSDGVTTATKPMFTGTCVTNGDSVTIVVDGTATKTGNCSGSAYAITLTTALAEATHAISAFESNANGPSPQSASSSITVDLTGPDIEFVSTPAVYEATSTDPEFVFTVAEGRLSTAQCTLDGATVADDNCNTGDATYFSLAGGQHTFVVKATDAAGAVTTKQFTWQIGTAGKPAAPVLAAASDSGSSNSDGITNADPLLIQDTCTTGDSMQLYDDVNAIGAPVVCVGGAVSFSIGGAGEGSHAYTLTATRGGGAESAHSNVRTVVVDRTAPVLSIDGSPLAFMVSANIVSTTASFQFHDDDGSPMQCQLDGGAFAACSSPQTYNGLALGAHSFTVAATDTAGNAATPQAYQWTVVQPLASGAPLLVPASDSGMSSSDGVTNATQAMFAGACTDGDTIQLYDGVNAAGGSVVCASGSYNITLSNLSESSHSIAMTATRNGIESAKSAASMVTIDRTAPSAPAINGHTGGAALTATVLGLAEPGASVEVRDGGQFVCKSTADASANWTCTGSLSGSGTRSMTATATDVAGNTSDVSPVYDLSVSGNDRVFSGSFD
jgi:hypothetical protein